MSLITLVLSIASGAEEKRPAPADATEDAPFVCTPQVDAPVRRFSGTVADASGARVAQAQITLMCGNFRAAVVSGADGTYSVTVPAGKYLVLIGAPSFSTLSQEVTVGEAVAGTELHAVLRTGQVGSVVTVSAGNEFAPGESTSGTKTSIPLAEVPQAISIVNRQVLDSQGVVKLDDALKNVAGVMPGGYYDGWDYYRIRGFDASFNTYIDGLRGGNGVSEETWGLESVEILKGPSSALYGQSVLGGLVNIVTRKPVPDTFGHAQVTAGSFGFVDTAIDVGGSLNGSRTLYGRLPALFHTGDSFVNYAYRRRYYFAPSLTWKPTSSTTLTFMGRLQRDNSRQSMPLPAIGTALPNINGPLSIHTYIGELEANANKMSQSNQQFGYQFSHTLSEHFTVRQNGRFAWYNQDWNRIYYPSSFTDPKQRILQRYPLDWHGPWQTHVVDTNLDAHARFLGMEHSALLGVEFFRNPTVAQGSFGGEEPLDLYAPVYGANPIQTLVPYTNSKSVTQYTGIYLQDHIRLPKHVAVTAGGRLDLSKNEIEGLPNQNGTGLTPRLGVTWLAIPSTTFYGSFSKSFYPQSGQIYVAGSTTNGDYISPERGQQWEGGTKSSFLAGRVTTTLAVFQLNRKNVATTDPNHPNFYRVTGQQRSRGVELEAALHPLTGWNITTAYSYINAVVTSDTSIASGTPTLNAPKNIFNVWSTCEIPRGFARGLGLGVGGRHYTDQSGDLTNSFQLPGYGIVDASLTYRKGPSLWQVNGNNLTNKRYYSGSYNNLYVKPGEPLVVRGSVSWNF